MNNRINAEHLVNGTDWRYATKQFNPQRKINGREPGRARRRIVQPIQRRIAALATSLWSPTQQFGPIFPRFFYGQAQITDASHLVVFASKVNFNKANVDAFIQHTAASRGVPVESAGWLSRHVGGWHRAKHG